MVELQNKTPTYLDGSRSNFPNDVDKIPEKRDLPPNMKPKARKFQELVNKDTLTSTEQEELNNLTIELYEFLPTAEDWNKAFDMSIATQKHYKDNTINHVNQLKQETTDFVSEKKSEITTYTDNMKNDVTTHTATEKQKISNIADNNVKEVVNAKDEALLSIERKKDAIIEFLDGTDIGELRVDVGVMDELETKDKASLVGAVNEVNKQVSEPKYVSITSYDNVVPMPDGSTNGQVSVSVEGVIRTNLAPTFDNEKWAFHKNTTMNSPTKITLNSIGEYDPTTVVVKIKENQDYTLSAKHSGSIRLVFFDINNTTLLDTSAVTNQSITIKSPLETSIVKIYLYSKGNISGTYTFENVMLEEGVEVKSFITGAKSTISAMKVKSVGKNLFDGKVYGLMTDGGIIDGREVYKLKHGAYQFWSFKGEPNTQYTLTFEYRKDGNSVGPTQFEFLYSDGTKSIVQTLSSNTWFKIIGTSLTNKTLVGFKQTYNNIGTTYIDKKTFMLEKGNTATEYEPYKESTAYVIAKKDNKIVILTTVKDTTGNIISQDRIITKENGEMECILENKSISNVATSTVINYADMKDGGYFNAYGVDGEYQVGVKGDTLTFTATKLIYQLAEPEIIPIRWTGLQGYENGTLYFDTIIPEIGVYYNSGLQTHYLDHPIASIDTLYKVDKETGLRTSLDVSKCILAEDKLSFTHPDLIDGDLVDWDYVPTTESTNGGKTIIASTNMSAAVDSLLKDSQTQKENIRQANSRLDNCDNKINNQEDKINNLSTEVVEHKAEKATQHEYGHIRLQDIPVKSVNKKTGEVTIGLSDIRELHYSYFALGESAKASNYQGAIAIGFSAEANNYQALALGTSTIASGFSATALGHSAEAINGGEGVLGDSAIGTRKWIVPGSFTVNGTKNFEIPHPKPQKKATHVIRHGAVESPTAGDTLYRYTVQAHKDNDTVIIDLPDYFIHLNKDVQIFVTGQGHFGNGYGILNRETEQLEIHCQHPGGYNILVIGTRNDDHQSVQDWGIKGVEREIGESWTGETYVFEVDEIMEVEEIKEEVI